MNAEKVGLDNKHKFTNTSFKNRKWDFEICSVTSSGYLLTIN